MLPGPLVAMLPEPLVPKLPERGDSLVGLVREGSLPSPGRTLEVGFCGFQVPFCSFGCVMETLL
jgi:hypothetical protein